MHFAKCLGYGVSMHGTDCGLITVSSGLNSKDGMLAPGQCERDLDHLPELSLALWVVVGFPPPQKKPYID